MSQSIPPPPQFPVGYGYTNAPRRSNGAAVASLVLGILGCIPLITGLLAILLGIIGIRKSSRDPLVGGQGMAIAGLILGIISILGWTGVGGVLGYAYVESKPARVVAQQFVTDLSAGNINAAMADSSGFSSTQLQTESTHMASFGGFQSIRFFSFNVSTMNGQTSTQLGGMASFSKGPKVCTFTLVKTAGVYKVTAYTVQ